MTELEERLDLVYAAKTFADLEPVIADLPDGSAGAALTRPGSAVGEPQHALIGGNPGSTTSIAIMSGTDRRGNWVVPRRHNSFACWGGIKLDLRTARFAERHTTITAVAIMGGIDIIVPDDITVEVTGIGFMGAFESKGESLQPPSPNAPVLRVTGFAFWGGVTVKRKPRHSAKKHIGH